MNDEEDGSYASEEDEDYEYQYSDDDDDDDDAAANGGAGAGVASAAAARVKDADGFVDDGNDDAGGGGDGDDDDDDDDDGYEDGDGMDIDDPSGQEGTQLSSSRRGRKGSGGRGGGSARKSGVRRKADNNPNAAPVGGAGGGGGGVGGGGAFGEILGDLDSGASVRMVDSADLAPIMKRRLREVTEVLDIPTAAAAVLMREHHWAKERLFETFYEDPEKVLKSCGVLARCRKDDSGYGGGAKKPPPSHSGRVTRSSAAAAAATFVSMKRKAECEICYDEDGFSPDEMLGMPCGHEFCYDCWRGFVEVALTNGPASVRTTCPQAGCNEIVTEVEVGRAAPDLLPKFEGYQLRNFVEMSSQTRWCPGPGCERVAIGMGSGGLFGDAAGDAECDSCMTKFCLRCGEEPHAPITCRDLVRWNEKCRNESETANWILANTKPCPKCSSRIEKNQGCNHMSCQQCKYEFCWICMGNWSDHGANTGGYYRCNKFDPSDDKTDQSEAAKAKRELDRYLHYYKRYHAHAEAQKFAKKQLHETEQRMVVLQEQSSDATWTDVEFLKAANEQLVECRRVLKYTYSFAYYLTEPVGVSKHMSDASASAGIGNQKTMRRERFEHHQEMLERFTENLSELSEKPLVDMDRTEVVNVTRVVDRFMKNILKYVEDGMEEG